MNRKFLFFTGLLLCAVLLFYLLPNDEKEIRNKLQQLTLLCSSSNDDSSLQTISSAGKIAKLCTIPCSIDIESFNIKRNFIDKEISQHVLMMKRMLPDTRFALKDIQITFPQKNNALITATLSLHGKTRNERFTDAYELDIASVKSDGDWLFSSFTVVEFMQR